MYWDTVLKEVLNKNKHDCVFTHTNVGASAACKNQVQDKPDSKKPQRYKLKTYCLGEKYGDLYLTRRETECVVHLLQGKTVPETAKILGLSPRTIEFYVKNIKVKLNCRTKIEILRHVLNSDLLKHVDFI